MTGDEIKKRRKALKLNQTELANLIGVTRNTVARWERNEMKIPSEMLDLALTSVERKVPSDFDLATAIQTLNDPSEVLNAWYKHDGLSAYDDYSPQFFHGWDAFTLDERVEAITDVRRVLDRQNK